MVPTGLAWADVATAVGALFGNTFVLAGFAGVMSLSLLPRVARSVKKAIGTR